MTSYFEFNERKRGGIPMGDVIEFKQPDNRQIEHIDSSTIVERLELTPELRAEFEAAGYTIDEDAAS
jgi:hypothetical protein